MNPKQYPSRYIHTADAFAVGGVLTFGPAEPDLQISTIAPVVLPDVGGISESTGEPPPQKDRELISVGLAHTLVQSDPDVVSGPAGSRTLAEVRSFRMDRLSIDYCRLALRSVCDFQSDRPRFSLRGTEISGMRLGTAELKITLDTDIFDRYPTLHDLNAAFREKDLRRELEGRFVIDPATGGLHRRGGFAVGSMLLSVDGLPSGASVQNGTIEWPGFGKVVIGEVLIGENLWRATMVRIVHSFVDVDSGSSGGTWYP